MNQYVGDLHTKSGAVSGKIDLPFQMNTERTMQSTACYMRVAGKAGSGNFHPVIIPPFSSPKTRFLTFKRCPGLPAPWTSLAFTSPETRFQAMPSRDRPGVPLPRNSLTFTSTQTTSCLTMHPTSTQSLQLKVSVLIIFFVIKIRYPNICSQTLKKWRFQCGFSELKIELGMHIRTF